MQKAGGVNLRPIAIKLYYFEAPTPNDASLGLR
jgi:hypothetical protein